MVGIDIRISKILNIPPDIISIIGVGGGWGWATDPRGHKGVRANFTLGAGSKGEGGYIGEYS